MRRAIDRTFVRAARIIVLGAFWAETVAKHVPSKRDHIVILPNASRRVDSSTEYEHASQQVNILFLGKLGPKKGTPILLSALAGIRGIEGWHATLAGDGDVSKTRDEVVRLGLLERVTVPGWVGSLEVENLLRSSDILVLPSQEENLPMSIVEAFAHGLAVIATPVGSIPDLVEPERTGLLMPVDDASALRAALERLLGDSELRLRLGSEARSEHQRRLNLSTYASRIVDIWREGSSIYEVMSSRPGYNH